MNKTRKNSEMIYKNEHYNSNDGMLTTVWGPGMWHFMHTMSFNYPTNPSKDDIEHYKNFVINLKNVLPCGKCRDNFSNLLKKYPLTNKHLKNRETFSRYIYEVHEMVNKSLNKKSNLSFEQVRNTYEHFRARCALNKTQKKKLDKEEKDASEKGCTEPIYGEKSKCILHIVPQTKKGNTLQIDDKCLKRTV